MNKVTICFSFQSENSALQSRQLRKTMRSTNVQLSGLIVLIIDLIITKNYDNVVEKFKGDTTKNDYATTQFMQQQGKRRSFESY